MDTILYFFYTAAYIALVVWMLSGVKDGEAGAVSSVLFLVLFGLIYDNAVLATGKWIGEGALLETLNLLRYWIHAFFTPLLVLFSWSVLDRAGIEWARTRTVKIGAFLLTIALVILEIVTAAWGLTLEPVREYGVLSYESVAGGNGPPWMVLFVSAALIVSGAFLWKKTGWIWMLIGSVIMTIGSAVPIQVDSSAATNGFELILLLSLVATKVQQDKKISNKGEKRS